MRTHRNPRDDKQIAEGLRRLAELCRRLRLSQGLTLEEAAERSDIDVRHVQLIEAGTGNPTVATLVRVARGLGVGLDVLMGGKPEGRSSGVSEAVSSYRPERTNTKEADLESDAIVAARVKSMRLAQDWSQAELAARSGLSQGAVQAVEARTKSPTLRTLDALASALGITTAALLAPIQVYRKTRARAGRS